MSRDDGADDDPADGVPPLPPDDRLWRHPSEVSAFGHGRLSPPVASAPTPPASNPRWAVALSAGLVGAVLCGGVLALTGNLAVEGERIIERVKVSPIVPPPSIAEAQGVDAVAEQVSRSMVRLRVTIGGEETSACGVVLRDDGIVVTSAHEVAEATAITVVLSDGRKMDGELVGADLPSDVGVIRIDAGHLTVAVLSTEPSEELPTGATTIAMGTTSEGELALSTGVISSLGARLDADRHSLHGLIKTDAPIEAGWAGGPLVDASGAVIGITTDLGDADTRFAFATPIELVRRFAEELLVHGKVSYGWLGIEGRDLGEAKADVIGITGGAEVRRVMAGSPADRAGLVSGDILTEVAGDDVRSSTDLVVALRRHKPGEVVIVGYWRGGRRHEVEVTIDVVP